MSKIFDEYTLYYDLLYRDKDYASEASYVASHFQPGVRHILELGCGSGGHAEHLARLGYTVHGIDFSESMLACAETRKNSLPSDVAARLNFNIGDVRTIRTNHTYDAVISLFHVVSYQTSNADLAAIFETASSHLIFGGLFLFDFWYGPAVLCQAPVVRVKRLENDQIKVSRIAEPVLCANDNLVEVNYLVFIEKKMTGKIEQLQETHRMRYLFLPELIHFQCGKFMEVETKEWLSKTELGTSSWSGFQILSHLARN